MHNFCGSDATKRPSKEEMGKVVRMQPGAYAAPSSHPSTESGDGASDKQMNMIRAVSKSMGILPPSDLATFTKRQASAYIDQLKNPQPDDQNLSDEEPF